MSNKKVDNQDNAYEISQYILFTIGLPASGKSTWADEFVNKPENKDNWVKVSRDDLRYMRGQYWIPDQENMITDWEVINTAIALMRDKSVIIDATNLHEYRRDQFVQQVLEAMRMMGSGERLFAIQEKLFDTPVYECIRRDAKRTEGKVGSQVILNMARKAGMFPESPIYKWKSELPFAIICDIDGTLAHNRSGRGFYDWSRVGEDSIDPIIGDMLIKASDDGTKIIIVSGRDAKCYSDTHDWLNKHNIPFDYLFMRPQGNNEKDAIIKERIYNEQIKGKFNIKYVLDDRDQVVDMWRSLGLKCLQVDAGDF